MRHLSRREWAFLALILVVSFIPVIGGLVRAVELGAGITLLPPNPRAAGGSLPILLHVLGSGVFCLGGALQVLPSLRARAPGAHRALGRVVALAGVLSAATGLWMTHVFIFPTPLQGPLLYWVRMAVGLGMIALILGAVMDIRSGDVGAHRVAMLRAYALGQGAATQTVLGLSWVVIIGTEPLGLPRDILMTLAWIVNLAIAELVIRAVRAEGARGGAMRAG